MSQTPHLAEVVEAGVDERLEKFVTAIPARVRHWNSLANTVDIEGAVTNATEDSAGRKTWIIPRVNNVPVLYPGAGKNRITFPIKEGDYVLYIVSSLPTTDFNAKGGRIGLDLPSIARNNVCNNGYVIPGVYTSPEAGVSNIPSDEDNMVVAVDNKLKLGAKDGTQPTIMANTFLSKFDDVINAVADTFDGITPGLGSDIRAALTLLHSASTKTTKVEVK